MVRMIAIVCLVAMTTVAQAASGQSTARIPAVTGTVTYRQRSALPPNATLHVQVQDVSRQDIAATTVAEATMLTGTKQVPLPFVVVYETTAIDPKHTYAVRATISFEGQMAFTSTTRIPVITHGAPTNVEIVVSAAPPAQSKTSLEGSNWQLVELDGAPAKELPEPHVAQIEFLADGKIAASGGCNRLLGSYELKGDALSIMPGGMTMMACEEPLMAQERAFTQALGATKTYRIEGDTLALMEGERVLARFRAHAAK